MIVREWRGRALRSRGDAYPNHFRNTVVPQLRTLPGFLGADLCRRERGDVLEFVVLTRWESLDAVRAFAGESLDKAVVEPDAIAALSDFDSTVQHYEVLAEIRS
jgi:heme-degrading monooxygenase HmoA